MNGPFNFGYGSLKQLDTCHPNIRAILNEAIKTYNFTIVQGWRGQAEQEKDFAEGKSQKHWPDSKHNHEENGRPCSLAADCAPYDSASGTIVWNDKIRFGIMIGHIQSAAARLNIPIRTGADFNQNGRTNDDGFQDLPHIELL